MNFPSFCESFYSSVRSPHSDPKLSCWSQSIREWTHGQLSTYPCWCWKTIHDEQADLSLYMKGSILLVIWRGLSPLSTFWITASSQELSQLVYNIGTEFFFFFFSHLGLFCTVAKVLKKKKKRTNYNSQVLIPTFSVHYFTILPTKVPSILHHGKREISSIQLNELL